MSTPELQPDPNRITQILDRLMAWSDQGQLQWEVGSPPDSFAADIARGMRVRLRSRDGNGEPPFLVEIWGPDGNLEVQTDSSNQEVARKIVGLYKRGKMAALDPNKMLVSIERELGLR